MVLTRRVVLHKFSLVSFYDFVFLESSFFFIFHICNSLKLVRFFLKITDKDLIQTDGN